MACGEESALDLGCLRRLLTKAKYFRVDITAALLHDTKPLFPLSKAMAGTSVSRPSLKMLSNPLPSIFDENKQDTRFVSVASCLGDLHELAARLQLELAIKGDAIWDDEEQMGFLVNPVTHHLLDQQPATAMLSEPMTPCDVISGALRLGAIIWIILVKRRCRSYPGTAEARVSRLLKTLLEGSDTQDVWNNPDLRLARLWLLVLCSISDPGEEDLATAMGMIGREMMEQNAVSWDEIMSGIRQMPWVAIFEPPCAALGQRLLKDFFGIPLSFSAREVL